MDSSKYHLELETIDCPKRKQWVSFRLVNEHGDGKPYADLVYVLHDSQGQVYEGTVDNAGYAEIKNIYCGPSVLSLSATYKGGEKWYATISNRDTFTIPLTALQVAAEQSPTGPRHADGKTWLAEERAQKEGATFYRTEVSDFFEANKHLPDRDDAWQPRPPVNLKRSAGLAAQQQGVALQPNTHHVIEIKALRALSPMLSRGKTFCALNAYHLAVMSTFSYASFSKKRKPREPYFSAPPPYQEPGSIGNVLREQLSSMGQPTLFNTAGPYHLICEEVPYSKRLEVMPYDPERYAAEAADGWQNPEDVHFFHDETTETQAFITHNDQVVVISVRGTEGLSDILRDMDARQVPYEEGNGQAHRGFYKAFQAATVFVDRYMRAFHRPDHSVVICGHSLGGAIALMLAEWLRRNWSADTQLYTFGAPRAADRAFVQGAQALTHHRLVNHNDPIPGMPFTWMDAEWKLVLPGTVALLSAPPIGSTLILGGLLNLKGDPYEHHGEQWHFMPRTPDSGTEAAVLWQPGCDAIDEQACALYAGAIDLRRDMPERDSLIKHALSMGDHSSDGGYSRATLTTLLRWHAAVTERDGALFTTQELRDIDRQVENARQAMAAWQPGNFAEFQREIRLRHDVRFYGKTDMELRRLYDEGIHLARQLSQKQTQDLQRARQRLLSQSLRPLTEQSLFGELHEHPELESLVDEWSGLKENAAAARLALVTRASGKHYA